MAGQAQHHQQGRTGGAFDRSEALQTGSEGEHSNRLDVLNAEDWPASKVTVSDECHRPLLEAVGLEIMQRAHAGDETILLFVKSHISIHGNEMADNSRTSSGCNRPFKSRQQKSKHA